MESVKRSRCPKAMPLLKEGQRVMIKHKGKMACGFVTVIKQEPISRYVVTVITYPWDFPTFQEFIDAMVAGIDKMWNDGAQKTSGPQVWAYVYKRRDELEASVLGITQPQVVSTAVN